MSQAQCWWKEPFWECMICTSCNRIHSIEDLSCMWFCEDSFTFSWSHLPNCLHCKKDELEFMYFDDSFGNIMREYIKWHVCLILLLTPQRDILWFWTMVKKQLKEILEYEMNTRPNSYDFDEVRNNIWFWSQDEILCLQQIYTDSRVRGSGMWIHILQEMFDFFSEFWDLPVLMETHYASPFYSLSEAMWFSDIWVSDRYWYTMKINTRFSSVLEKTSNRDMSVAKEAQLRAQQIIWNKPSLSLPKFYK